MDHRTTESEAVAELQDVISDLREHAENQQELVEALQGLVEDLRRNDRRNETLLTYAEAAHLLGVSIRKVQRYVADGDLPSIVLDGSVRIHPKALDAFIRERLRRTSNAVGGRR